MIHPSERRVQQMNEPPHRGAGLVQVFVSPKGTLEAKRVSLVAESRYDLGAVDAHGARPTTSRAKRMTIDDFNASAADYLQTSGADLAIVFHGGGTPTQLVRSVYWIPSPLPDGNVAVTQLEPVAVFPTTPSIPWITALTFFASGQQTTSLCFAVVDRGQLRVFVAHRMQRAQVVKEVPAANISAVTFAREHRVVWYQNDSEAGAGGAPLGIADF